MTRKKIRISSVLSAASQPPKRIAYEKRARYLCSANRSLHRRLRHQPKLSARDQSTESRAADWRLRDLQYRSRAGDYHGRYRTVSRLDDGAARCVAVDDADGVGIL